MTEDLSEKKKRIVENIGGSEENLLELKEDISEHRKAVEEIEENADLMLSEVRKSKLIYDAMPDEAFHNPPPVFRTIVISGEVVSEQMHGLTARLRQNFHELVGQMPVGTSLAGCTTATDVSSLAFRAGTIIQPEYPAQIELKHALEEAKVPSPIEERNELGDKLKSIEPRLYEKFEGMWQTLTDTTKKDRFRQSASSMREIVSEFLQVLAPDEEVKKTRWWESVTKDGKPSQKQRVKYGIIGMREEAALPDQDLDVIENLMDDARNRYEDLNRIAHARDPESEELFPLLESYIASCQRIIKDILRLRDRYFVE